MAHIALDEDLPGIIALWQFRPETAAPLKDLADALLRGPNTLARAERELIGAYVSNRNHCVFCARAHSAIACEQFGDGADPGLVDQVHADPESAPISDKLKALLRIADKVRQGGLHVTRSDVARARAAGATDTEIHDAVLIAAMFSMFNRYVDGLDAEVPDDPSFYARTGRLISEHGYGIVGGTSDRRQAV